MRIFSGSVALQPSDTQTPVTDQTKNRDVQGCAVLISSVAVSLLVDSVERPTRRWTGCIVSVGHRGKNLGS